MRSQVLISDKSSNDYVFAIFNPGSRYKNHPTTVVFLCFLFAHVKKSSILAADLNKISELPKLFVPLSNGHISRNILIMSNL